ncbi:hypothetical protein B0O80DRAFT_473419 [Mortierella sp. GBAus27b]|nr:hypothetical protein B0O80DRAFT_473419 [Mortierella sp. GBAus27b]
MRPRYQPVLCILDLLPGPRVVAFDNPFHCSYCRTKAPHNFLEQHLKCLLREKFVQDQL